MLIHIPNTRSQTTWYQLHVSTINRAPPNTRNFGPEVTGLSLNWWKTSCQELKGQLGATPISSRQESIPNNKAQAEIRANSVSANLTEKKQERKGAILWIHEDNNSQQACWSRRYYSREQGEKEPVHIWCVSPDKNGSNSRRVRLLSEAQMEYLSLNDVLLTG